MTPADLKPILAAEKADALASVSASKLTEEREKAQEYYNGEMKDLPVPAGRSSAVSMDVADTIEGLMPSLMEVFCGGDEVIRFEPVGPEDVQAAEQETDYVNHVFMQKNPGFLVLYSAIKDALLSKNGFTKVAWEIEDEEETETYVDQTEEALGIIRSDPELEITEFTDKGGLYDFKIKKRRSYGCAKVYPVPPEEVGISRSARSIHDASYFFHEVQRTQAELIEDGYDEEQVKSLATYGTQTTEEESRDTVDESSTAGAEGQNQATRLIRVTEHYIVVDYDGTGARRWCATTGGEQHDVLRKRVKDGDKERVEEQVKEAEVIPFASMTPVIVTHRFFGRSIADLVMDIQRIKTALLRALLDNAYLANNPRTEVSESHSADTTLDDLLVSRPGGIVRTKAPGGLNVIKHPDIGSHVYPLLEYQDATREWRTGVSRQGQGLNADALQNQSATAANQLYNAAQARTKLIARIFAETGIKDLFSLLHTMIRKHGSQAETVRLKNQWVQVDPRQWKTRNDLTINVGLGTGGKTERLMHLTTMMNTQKELLLGGKSNLVSDQNLYNTVKEMVKLIDLKTVEPYFTDPNSPEGQQAAQAAAQRPDPKMAEVQGKLQLEQQKAGADIQIEQAKMQTGAQSDQQRMQIEATLKREQMQAEFALRREQMVAEFQLKREQMMVEAEIKREANRMNAAARVESSKSDGITDTQMGGAVG